MYKLFYNLREKPFQISTDPKFLWLGEKHREALATLKYGVLDNKGFLLITGDVGTGKTTLINALTNQLGNRVIYATIPDPGLKNLDFFKYIAHVFKFDRDFENKGDFLIDFGRFLMSAYRKGKTVVLIIDEAQLLNQEMLEQIRLLSNIEKQQRKLINIFFVGQSEFNDTLLKYENRALRQRITINYNLDPLSFTETGAYIEHRLRKAGSIEKIFNTGAIKKIYAFSKGYPRLINIVCDHAMLTGYVKEARTIGARIIKECVKELNISPIARRGQAKPVRSGPDRHAAPVRQPGTGRTWTYIFMLVLLALVTLLFLKTGSSTEGLNAKLKQIEALITARGRSNAAVPGSGAETRPIKINDMPASIKTVPRNFARVVDPDVQPVPVDTRLAAASLQKKTLPAQTAPAAVEDSRVLRASVSPALPDSAHKEAVGAKDPVITNPADGSPGKTSIDPLAQAKEFMARTGGKLTIHFNYNSNEISKPEFEKLSDFAGIAAQTPEMMIIITGHTDTSGSAKYNQKLSRFRANIVKSYFVGKGVNPENIISIGKGLEAPLIKSDPGIKSLSNRRVEIELKLVLPPGQS